MELNLIVIKTAAPDKLKSQYEALGITFEFHRHGNGPFHYAAKLAGVVFEIYPLPKSISSPDNSTRLGFEIENLDQKILDLEKRNWKIRSNPTQTEWGYTAVVEDMDGRKVELKQKPISLVNTLNDNIK